MLLGVAALAFKQMKPLDKDFKFVVLGAGTAGLLTALFIKNRFPETNVTVIQSSEIGVIGSGEGTTPGFKRMMEFLNIPLEDVFKHADATFKSAIKFTNWKGDGSYYYHGFLSSYDDASYSPGGFLRSEYNLMALDAIRTHQSLDCINFPALICEEKLSPLSGEHGFPIGDHAFGLHFNAVKLAQHLSTVAKDRGINIVDNAVEVINFNDDDEVVGVRCKKDNTYVECDFLFDCSGFARLVIGKHYNSEWTSYKHVIPNDHAMPFFLDIDEDYAPQTEAIAMEHGWVWKIPTKNRYGCGYVFSSNHTNTESVKKEILDKFGHKVHFPRDEPFRFEAGCYKETWKKNCIALGLSSGFIEPLEATSLMLLISSLFKFIYLIQGLTNKDQKAVDTYNQHVYNSNKEILEFILLHYLSRKGHNSYWDSFFEVDSVKEEFKTISTIKHLDGLVPSELEIDNKVFAYHSYIEVSSGIGLYDPEKVDKLYRSLMVGARQLEYEQLLDVLDKGTHRAIEKLINHKRAVDIMSS